MPYDDGLAHRVRRTLGDRPDLAERRMFGGLAFLVRDHMVCGVLEESLVARVGPDAYDDALDAPHTREFDFTGRPLRGFVYVDPAGVSEDEDLARWVERSLTYVKTLPPK